MVLLSSFFRRKNAETMKILKTLSRTMMLTIAMVAMMASTPSGNGVLEIGDMLPMMGQEVVDISGETTHLRELHSENGLLVIFSCNTCPFVLQWEDRYNELYAECSKNNIGMVLVNSNEAKRQGDDSMAKMKAKAKAEGYKMNYVVDENHEIADAFGARTTPHVFLFDRDAKLAYRGLFDDNGENKDDVSNHYLTDAIGNMVAGESINPSTTKSVGCSIKRLAP